AAVVYKISSTILRIDPFTGVRFLSYVSWLFFGYFGVRTLYVLIGNLVASRTSAAMLLFWPVGIAMASRVNNDMLLDALFAGAFFYLTRWVLIPSKADFIRVWLWACAALLIKSSAVALWVVIGLTVFFSALRLRITPLLVQVRNVFENRSIVAALLLALGFAFILNSWAFVGPRFFHTTLGGASSGSDF